MPLMVLSCRTWVLWQIGISISILVLWHWRMVYVGWSMDSSFVYSWEYLLMWLFVRCQGEQKNILSVHKDIHLMPICTYFSTHTFAPMGTTDDYLGIIVCCGYRKGGKSERRGSGTKCTLSGNELSNYFIWYWQLLANSQTSYPTLTHSSRI